MDKEKSQMIIKGALLGYLTRKYHRDYPIKEQCCKCNIQISGKIYRKEEDIIIYNADNKEDSGWCSSCRRPISVALQEGSDYVCDCCMPSVCGFNDEEEEIQLDGSCSICLGDDNQELTKTKCGHVFHLECLVNWIKINNKTKTIFEGSCPICKQIL